MTIVEFLEARIAEDEAAALPFRNELGETKQWRCDDIGGVVRYVGRMEFGLPDLLAKFDTHLEGAHVERWDPARVLAECAAKRAILELHGPVEDKGWISGKDHDYLWCGSCGTLDDSPTPFPCETLGALAAVYSDHPDYDKDWAL